jgi:hypothetical protein
VSVLQVMVTALQLVAANPPFRVGERFEYAAKFGVLRMGSGAIEVASIDTIRGKSAYHFRFTLNAKAIVYKINSSLESWASVDDFHSLRFRRDNTENSRRYVRSWEIFGDSGYHRQVEPEPLPAAPTPADPLDDASFLFFVRTTPLEVGKTYNFERYFRPERNPIVIKVLKRETMELPDGSEVDCLVLNPVIGDGGLFGARAEARLWITDDARRIPVQIRSRYSFGTVTLKLERITYTP